MSGFARVLLAIAASLALFLLPAAIWTFLSGTFTQARLIEFAGFLLLFTVIAFLRPLGPLAFELPNWLEEPPGLYVIAIIPVTVLSIAVYLLLHRRLKVSRQTAAFIAANGSILLAQAAGFLMMSLYARNSGP
jgi:hypothetical protein